MTDLYPYPKSAQFDVSLVSCAALPTAYGVFDLRVFTQGPFEHALLSVGLPQDSHNVTPLVRIHSECLTGDAFLSLKCDCGPQLQAAMQMIQARTCGAILYLRQEGRGIGLANKIQAYALQDQGHDTLEANLMLGLPADGRTYEMCAPMLTSVGLEAFDLLTNNPLKIDHLTHLGFCIKARIPIRVGQNPLNRGYLEVKDKKMGHLIFTP